MIESDSKYKEEKVKFYIAEHEKPELNFETDRYRRTLYKLQ